MNSSGLILDIIEPVEDISLWALDETGKRLESNNFYSWSPVGEPTVIERNGCHKGLNIIGATEILKHFNFVYDAYTKSEGTVTAAHIIKFLERLVLYDRARGINITVVQWDNANIHKAYEVKQFVKAHESDLILIHQPPYSPELNPQENMWNWMKKFLSQASAYKNEQELAVGLKKFKAYIEARPDEVKQWLYARNFFK
jgi:transposase